jgi:hypothetical protein
VFLKKASKEKSILVSELELLQTDNEIIEQEAEPGTVSAEWLWY